MTRVPFSLPMEGVSKFRIFQSRFFFFYFLISGKDDRMLRLKNLEERIYPSRNSIFEEKTVEENSRSSFSRWKAFRNFEFFKIASFFSLEDQQRKLDLIRNMIRNVIKTTLFKFPFLSFSMKKEFRNFEISNEFYYNHNIGILYKKKPGPVFVNPFQDSIGE